MRKIAGVMILTALLILSGCSVADVETDQHAFSESTEISIPENNQEYSSKPVESFPIREETTNMNPGDATGDSGDLVDKQVYRFYGRKALSDDGRASGNARRSTGNPGQGPIRPLRPSAGHGLGESFADRSNGIHRQNQFCPGGGKCGQDLSGKGPRCTGPGGPGYENSHGSFQDEERPSSGSAVYAGGCR